MPPVRPKVTKLARKYVFPSSEDSLPEFSSPGRWAARGSKMLNSGSCEERCVRDGMGREEGKAGTARRVWRSCSSKASGGVETRPKGAVKSRARGWRRGCFFLGAYRIDQYPSSQGVDYNSHWLQRASRERPRGARPIDFPLDIRRSPLFASLPLLILGVTRSGSS